MILIRKAINGLAYFFLMGSVVDSKTRPRGGGKGWEKLENGIRDYEAKVETTVGECFSFFEFRAPTVSREQCGKIHS